MTLKRLDSRDDAATQRKALNQKQFYRDEPDGRDKTFKNKLPGLNQKTSYLVFDLIRIDPLYPSSVLFGNCSDAKTLHCPLTRPSATLSQWERGYIFPSPTGRRCPAGVDEGRF
jgi:hypothetical protein